jgi:hypothetical protein
MTGVQRGQAGYPDGAAGPGVKEGHLHAKADCLAHSSNRRTISAVTERGVSPSTS